MDPRCFGSYLSQILMYFVSIWVILKADSCWAALTLYRIENIADTAIPSLYRYRIAEPYFLDRSQPCWLAPKRRRSQNRSASRRVRKEPALKRKHSPKRARKSGTVTNFCPTRFQEIQRGCHKIPRSPTNSPGG